VWLICGTANNSCSCWDSACFSLHSEVHTCVGLVVAVVLQKRASKVRVVPFDFEILEIQAQTL